MNKRKSAVITGLILLSVIILLTGCGGGVCPLKGPCPAGPKTIAPIDMPDKSFDSSALGRAIKVKVFSNADTIAKAPAIIYLKGLASKRLGSVTDDQIIADLQDKGFTVISVDFEGDIAAKVPAINPDILKLRGELAQLAEGVAIDANSVFVLPAGYTLEKDVLVYPDGDVRMDIRYPAGETEAVPVVLQIAHDPRNRSSNNSYFKANDSFCDGLLCTGYAVAMVDYPKASPRVNLVIPVKSALRTMRANAGKWNIDPDHIGAFGHSKGSGVAGLLATTDGRSELEDSGLFTEYSNKVQVACLNAGRLDLLNLWADGCRDKFTTEPNDSNREYLASTSPAQLLNETTCPLFLAVGSEDSYRTKQIMHMADACKKAGIDYRLHIEEGMGHSVNPDVNVIASQYEFFDKYLKPALVNN